MISLPHSTLRPFDMVEYIKGDMCVLGGRDFEKEEKELKEAPVAEARKIRPFHEIMKALRQESHS